MRATLLGDPVVDDVDLVVRGCLEDPRIDASASVSLTRLHRLGRLCSLRYGEANVGSVDLTCDGHPVDSGGRPQERIWVFGAVTEGVRYFAHYIPSHKRGVRAFEAIGACVGKILS